MLKKITHAFLRSILTWLLVFLAVILVTVVIVFQYKQYAAKRAQSQNVVTAITQVPPAPEPQKTDYGSSVPADFPADIPLEKGSKVEQSYGLNYVGQKQLTIVFLSTKTVTENYALYADFLKTQGWTISNTYESPTLSSLYGTKEGNDINVTISENTAAASAKSQVSISILKK